MKITYQTYEIAIVTNDGLKFFKIVACDYQAACNDLFATYGDDVEISHYGIV